MTTTFLERKSTLWAVALISVLLAGLTNLPWTLDDYDQAKQAYTSFEMVQEGHWFYQHTPNERIATKPPLVGWISAGLHAATGSWELAWRLPSFAAALALALVLTRGALAAGGPVAGMIALGAFGLNLLTVRLGTLVRTDMPLAFVIFLLGYQIWRKVRADEPWNRRDRLLAFALLTATMLLKGPIVYAFLLPGIVLVQWEGKRRGGVGRTWSGWWPWLLSLGVFLLWVAGGIAWTPGFYEQVVLHEFAGRFGETAHRPQPFYFYLPHLLHKFAPWSLLLLAVGVVAWRERKTAPRMKPETLWLLAWSLGGLLVMSVIPSKRVDRIFPVLPPLALLLAMQVSRLTRAGMTAPRLRRWTSAALLVAIVCTGGYAAQKIISGYRAHDGALVEFGNAVREQAAARGWRYAIVGGREEGLLLYLRRTHFMAAADAVSRWKDGLLDALIVPAEDSAGLQAQLPNAAETSRSAAITVNGRPRAYVLLTRASQQP